MKQIKKIAAIILRLYLWLIKFYYGNTKIITVLSTTATVDEEEEFLTRSKNFWQIIQQDQISEEDLKKFKTDLATNKKRNFPVMRKKKKNAKEKAENEERKKNYEMKCLIIHQKKKIYSIYFVNIVLILIDYSILMDFFTINRPNIQMVQHFKKNYKK